MESFNGVVAGYEAQARLDRSALDGLQKTVNNLKALQEASEKGHALELAQAKDEAANLKSEAERYRADAARMSTINLNYVERMKGLEAKVGSLKEEVRARDALLETKVKRARADLNEQYGSRFGAVLDDLENLKDAHARAAHLSQAQGNIELINDIRGENPPDLDVELAGLQDFVASDSGVWEEVGSLLAKIRGQLVVLPVSPDPTEVHLRDETIKSSELVRIGVKSQYGSNVDSPIFQSGIGPLTVPEPSSIKIALESSNQAAVETAGIGEPSIGLINPAEKTTAEVPEASNQAPP